MDSINIPSGTAPVPPGFVALVFRCVESKFNTNAHGRFSYSGLLSALDQRGQHIDPRQGFPAKGSMHYAINGELPYPQLEEGKCYQLAFVEVPEPVIPEEREEEVKADA